MACDDTPDLSAPAGSDFASSSGGVFGEAGARSGKDFAMSGFPGTIAGASLFGADGGGRAAVGGVAGTTCSAAASTGAGVGTISSARAARGKIAAVDQRNNAQVQKATNLRRR